MSSKRKLPQEWPGIHHIDEQEIEAVSAVLAAQSPFRFYGPKPRFETAQFEKEFAAFIGVDYCVAMSNGTTALQVALSALEVGPGDEVIMPGYFWVSIPGAVGRLGAVPVLVDVDGSFSMDPEDLEKKITQRTKAIILVHMGGVIGQVEEIVQIAGSHGIALLEDCAQAAGASKFGKMAGAFGDISIFSFQINKNMNAGEGGAVVTSKKELYQRAFAIHDTGYIKDNQGDFVLDNPSLQLWGIGCRMSELSGAMARVQLKKLPMIVNHMRTFKNELKELLQSYSGIQCRQVDDPEGDSGGFLKLIFSSRELAYQFKQALLDHGIEVENQGFYPIHMEQWGLHIYYNIPGLVNKTPALGRWPIWDLYENRFASQYSYGRGTLPWLDDYITRTVLFCIASNLTEDHKSIIKKAFVNSCTSLGL